MTKELEGRIAFVTGSGRGLGHAFADRLAELGADVAIHDISWTAPAQYGEASDLGVVAKEIARHGGRVASVTGNIGDKAAVARMKEKIEAELGTVDVLVNCAGGDIGASGGKPEPNDALAEGGRSLTAVLEPGALEARHVRLLKPEWWSFYPPRAASELAACLAAARVNRLKDDADYRTPWEKGDDGAIEPYELAMIRRSAENMRALGLGAG